MSLKFLKNFNALVLCLLEAGIFVLVVIASMVIYTLMLLKVDKKVFEFGMLRCIGMKKKHLLIHLIFSTLEFGLLALSLAVVFAYLVY